MGRMTLRKGDRKPWVATLTSQGADDLTGVVSVTLTLVNVKTGVKKITDGPCSVVASADALEVTYNPTADDVDTPGVYKAQWLALYGGGITARWPSDGDDRIEIQDSLD